VRIPLATRYPDYDTKGHVNNAVYLTYFEMARQAAWTTAMPDAPDLPFIVAEATVKYVTQARIGDPLEIEISTAEVRTKAWVWTYTVRHAVTGRVVAEGRTAQVMYDYEARQSVPIPDAVRAALATV